MILTYQAKHGLARRNASLPAYIEVLPSDELARFDLKGLTPEMFCVNIADMVNGRGMFSGEVENEKQVVIARWSMNKEEYLEASRIPLSKLTHMQIASLLALFPAYIQEMDNHYIDFAERVVPHASLEHNRYSGYRFTIVTEEIEDDISSYAYYTLDTCVNDTWQDNLPPQTDFVAIRNAVDKLLQAIHEAGVQLSEVRDETDYAV